MLRKFKARQLGIGTEAGVYGQRGRFQLSESLERRAIVFQAEPIVLIAIYYCV